MDARALARLAPAVLAGALALSACASGPETAPRAPAAASTIKQPTKKASPKKRVAVRLVLRSPEFKEGARIPERFTCNGEDASPPLRWKDVPKKTAGLAIIMDDPDAPGVPFTHWTVFNIPPDITELDAASVPPSAREGLNDFGSSEYGGPCPPGGDPHHYRFTLYALGSYVELDEGASVAEVRREIQRRTIASDTLTGRYANN